jgi:O-antigen ligase
VFYSRISLWGGLLFLFFVGVSLGRFNLIFGPTPLNSLRMLQGAFILLSFVTVIKTNEIRKFKGKTDFGIPAPVLLGVVTYLITILIHFAIQYGEVLNQKDFRSWVIMVLIAPLGFLTANILYKRHDQVRQFLWVCLVIGVIQAGLAIIQMITPISFDELTRKIDPINGYTFNYYLLANRVYGIWTHPPEFGGLMATLLPDGIYLIWNTKGIKKIFSGVGVFIMILALLASGSIAPILTGFSLSILCFFAFSRGNIIKKTIIGIFLILMVFGIIYLMAQLTDTPIQNLPFLNRIIDPWGSLGIGGSGEARLIMYKEAISLWQRNPFWGVGFAQFLLVQTSPLALTAHSVYMEALAETGIVGVSGLLLLLISLFWQNIQLWRWKIPSSEKKLYLPVTLMFITILVVSLVDFTFNKWNFQLIFWVGQGIIAKRVFSQHFGSGSNTNPGAGGLSPLNRL